MTSNLKITAVSYRSLRTGRGYNNTTVEATAEVTDGQTAEAVLAELRFWVDKQVDDTLKREDAYEALESIEQQKVYAKDECQRIEKRVEAYRDLLKKRPKLAELARANGLGGDAILLEQI